MSTDWNVHCLDCRVTHQFTDANWRDADMAILCKHAKAIAALAPLINESDLSVELNTSFGRIDADWFALHADHRLVAISEYGYFMDQCAEYVSCACGSHRRCALKVGHDGEHNPAAVSRPPAAPG